MNGFKAFRTAFMDADLMQQEDDYTSFDGRRMRYEVLWAYYRNTAYQDAHKWARAMRAEYGLYKYIRNIYNPANRLGEFWKTHLLGGSLDLAAGDGSRVPSALPIATDNEALRPAISQVWRWSNWQTNKNVLSLWGAILGDTAIKISDDPVRRKVYLKLVHPGTIKEVTLDDFGNVKGYTIEYQRADPRSPARTVTYTETAGRDGDNVVYRTLLNGSLFAWDGDVAEWMEPYGFIPLVMIQHNVCGGTWGESEINAGLAKFRETDDLASKLSDQIRKVVSAPMLIAGIDKRQAVDQVSGREKTTTNPQPGREELPYLYGPIGASATPMVAPLDIQATAAYIESILKTIEKDYPELALDFGNVQGDVSGRALRVNQQPVVTKVLDRRVNYDDAIVRAQQMAVAIGGFRGYGESFSGFGLDSYVSGKLDHSIGERPVFAQDAYDQVEFDQAFWTAAAAAKNAGVPISLYLRRAGWSDEEIAALEASPEHQAKMAGLKTAALLADDQVI